LLPVSLLSSEALDATTIDAAALRLGPGKAAVAPPFVHQEDVNGDGRIDLLLQFPIPASAIPAGATTLCLTGTLPDARAFQACDAVRTV
jgi:hypothetical protein